jgi:septal ring factor EnvC (AmiA/AmiB activator)
MAGEGKIKEPEEKLRAETAERDRKLREKDEEIAKLKEEVAKHDKEQADSLASLRADVERRISAALAEVRASRKELVN